MAPQTPQRSSRPGGAVALLGHTRAAPKWSPSPPTLVAPRRSRGAPRSHASGPEMAPQTPQRSSRPGGAVALLDDAATVGITRLGARRLVYHLPDAAPLVDPGRRR